ncbi:hypothetical protein DEA98_25640 [Brucella pseudogrignonensis]|nr:hypothetical protein [Brucella pseudogrignonensis]
MADNQQDNKKQGSGKRGSHEQHVKAGEQSHKNDDKKSGGGQSGKASQQNDKNNRQEEGPSLAAAFPILARARASILPKA